MTPARPGRTLAELLAQHERVIIVQTLAQHGFSRKRAAEVLGVTRTDLWRRMRRLKIEVRRTSLGRPHKKNDT